MKVMTLKQMFALTPDKSSIIDYCYLRVNGSSLLEKVSSDICYNFFTIKKYISADGVCYQFYPRNHLVYSIYEVANALNFQLHVFDIALTSRFNKTKEIYLLSDYSSFHVSSSDILFPVESRKFGEILPRYDDNNWIIFTSTLQQFTRLPAPYDTDCSDENPFCFRNCIINKTVSQMNRFPFTEPAEFSLFGESQMKILSSQDLEENKLSSKWNDLQSQCRDMCRKTKCHLSITSTFVDMYYYYHPTILTLTASSPSSYPMTIMSAAILSLIDYASGVCSCISFWFGISFISINPFSHKIKKQSYRSSRKKSPRKVMTIIYYIFCAIGFVLQFSQVCQVYFAYTTSSKIQVSSNDVYKYASLGVCFRSHRNLNRSNYKQYGIKPELTEEKEDLENEMSTFTIKDFFALTPSSDQFVTQCSMKDNINIGMNTNIGTDCCNYFVVNKTIRGENVCYFITPLDYLQYSLTNVATSLAHQGEVYGVRLIKSFNSQTFKYFVVMTFDSTQSKIIPSRSRNFAQRVAVHAPEHDNRDNVIFLSLFNVNYTSLPSPYDTKCQASDSYLMYDNCLIQEFKKINRVPYLTPISDDRLDLKLMNYKDAENNSIRSIVSLIVANCTNMTSRIPCNQVISFTDTYTSFNSEHPHEIELKSIAPYSPTMIVTSVASMSFLDFIQFVCNSLGIWFGVSLMSLNPSRVIMQLRRYKIRRNITKVEKACSRITMIVCVLFCASGCIWQSIVVSQIYFEYKTSSRLEIAPTEELRYPNLVFCARLTEVIGADDLLLRNVTIRKIMELTPNASNSIASCSYRYDQTEALKAMDAKDCTNSFIPVKYVSGSDVCYAYVPQADLLYSLTKVSSALTDTGIIYKLQLINTLSFASHIGLIIYSTSAKFMATYPQGTWLPATSKQFAERITRDKAEDKDNSNYFVVQGRTYTIYLLPYPYDTYCTFDDVADTCVQECNKKFVKQRLNKVPFDEIISEPQDCLMLLPQDLRNKTVKSIVAEGKEYCSRICWQPSCHYGYTLTEASDYRIPVYGDNIVLVTGLPKSNELQIQTFPGISLIDFLNSLCVSSSMWLGVSILSLFPEKYFKSRKHIVTSTLQSKSIKQNRMHNNFIQRNCCNYLHCQAVVAGISHNTNNTVHTSKWRIVRPVYSNSGH